MPVQDLTPQLRTRLSRVERAVGWFVIAATLLLLAGFAYYIYHTAEHKGWFKVKVRYHTFVNSGAGLHEGDPVKLMGFDVGEVSQITAMPPFSPAGNVYIEFIVQEPFYGYVWDDSRVKVTTADFLGKRTIEIVQGGLSTNKNLHATYPVDKNGKITGMWDPKVPPNGAYIPFDPKSKGYTLRADESPALGDRLENVANQVESALPGILALTNQITALLTNATQMAVAANDTLAQTRPLLSNFTVVSALLTNGQGALGDWLIPTNLNAQLTQTLASANTTLLTANTNVATLGGSLNQTLVNLANITSNLNAQVQTNDQIVSSISTAIVHADDLVQGLKRHWLLRSAFKDDKDAGNTNAPRRREYFPPAEPKTGKRF